MVREHEIANKCIQLDSKLPPTNSKTLRTTVHLKRVTYFFCGSHFSFCGRRWGSSTGVVGPVCVGITFKKYNGNQSVGDETIRTNSLIFVTSGKTRTSRETGLCGQTGTEIQHGSLSKKILGSPGTWTDENLAPKTHRAKNVSRPCCFHDCCCYDGRTEGRTPRNYFSFSLRDYYQILRAAVVLWICSAADLTTT